MDRIEVSYRLPALYRHDVEKGIYVSWCPALGLFSQGTTQSGAKKALSAVVTAYIRACYKRNILDRELQRRGVITVEPGVIKQSGFDTRHYSLWFRAEFHPNCDKLFSKVPK